MNVQTLKELPDQELLVRVKQLVQNERRATAALVAHLVEIECRKLYLGEGCRSLFTYCTEVLHLSEHAAYNRIEAARIAARFPLVLSHLAVGDVHLTAVRLLGPLLTADNHRELLAAAKHRSKRQIEELIARLRPQPDAPAAVRKLPARKPARTSVAATDGVAASGAASGAASAVAGTSASVAPTPLFGGTGAPTATLAQPESTPDRAPAGGQRPAAVVPLAPERYKVQFTATAATCGKLRRAQELLRHRIPDGDVAAVIDQALDLLVRELEKKKFAATARPQRTGAGAGPVPSPALSRADGPTAGPADAPARPERSRHIPAAVKRAVWQRDGGRCTFVGANGARCTERGQLEFDHIHPHADGGSAAAANLRLLCRQHNQYEARRFFGVWQAGGPEPLQQQASQA